MMEEVALLASQLPRHMEEVAALASSTLATLHLPLLPPCLMRQEVALCLRNLRQVASTLEERAVLLLLLTDLVTASLASPGLVLLPTTSNLSLQPATSTRTVQQLLRLLAGCWASYYREASSSTRRPATAAAAALHSSLSRSLRRLSTEQAAALAGQSRLAAAFFQLYGLAPPAAYTAYTGLPPLPTPGRAEEGRWWPLFSPGGGSRRMCSVVAAMVAQGPSGCSSPSGMAAGSEPPARRSPSSSDDSKPLLRRSPTSSSASGLSSRKSPGSSDIFLLSPRMSQDFDKDSESPSRSSPRDWKPQAKRSSSSSRDSEPQAKRSSSFSRDSEPQAKRSSSSSKDSESQAKRSSSSSRDSEPLAKTSPSSNRGSEPPAKRSSSSSEDYKPLAKVSSSLDNSNPQAKRSPNSSKDPGMKFPALKKPALVTQQSPSSSMDSRGFLDVERPKIVRRFGQELGGNTIPRHFGHLGGGGRGGGEEQGCTCEDCRFVTAPHVGRMARLGITCRCHPCLLLRKRRA